MKKKNNVVLHNKNVNPIIYEKYKDYVFDLCSAMQKELGDDVFVKVVFENERKGFHSDHFAAEVSKEKKSFLIQLFSVNFNNDDEKYVKYFLQLTLFHEFIHIHDIIGTIKNPHTNFEPDSKITNRREHILQLGFDFWTEFHAYSLGMHKFELDIAPNTFFVIYKNYKKLKAEFEKLLFLEDSKEKYKLVEDYTNRADEFIYLLTEYCAASHYKKFNVKEYSKKTEFDEHYIIITDFIIDATYYCSKLYSGMFGKRQEEKLFEIGKIVYKIRRELGIQ